MTKNCAYGGCKNDSRKPECKGLKWCAFPKPYGNPPHKDVKRAKRWLALIGRPHTFQLKNINRYTVICSDHFPPSEKDKLNLIKNKDLEPFYYKDGKAYGPPLPPSSASFVISTPAVTTLPTTKALPAASG